MKKLVGLGFIMLVVWYSLFTIRPPAPKPATAPADVFSAERAFKHVKMIGRHPHPLGSKDNIRVRNYIFSELQKMGLHPVVQQGTDIMPKAGLAGYVQNILVKIPGSAPQKTIMLMAHFDSVPNGPGATDDGFGVSTLLETLRALRATKPLKNNLWVLFTNGEERGLLGADYFTQANNNWKQVDLVMNVEARGTSGPVIMFETSSHNKNLIRELSKTSAHPVANSLAYTVYKLIPNDTDLSIMKKAGLNGMNFANIDGALNYHTAQDQPQNASKATLQDDGNIICSNVLYFGNMNFDLKASSDAVYFNGLTGSLIYYPASWSFPIAAACALILLMYIIFLFIRQKITPIKYILAMVCFMLICILGAFFTFGGWRIMVALHPSSLLIEHLATYANQWFLWGFSALMLGLSIAGYTWLQKRLGQDNLVAGIFSVIMIINLLLSWYLPTAGYLFLWPCFFAICGWVLIKNNEKLGSWKNLIILSISVLPALFIITPYIPLVQVALSTSALFISMFLLMILTGLCWLMLQHIMEKKAYYWSIALALVFVALMIEASLHSGFDKHHKKHDSLLYVQNLDTNKSLWLSSDEKTDAWTAQFLGKKPAHNSPFAYSPYWSARFLQAPAPYKKIEAPVLHILADSLADNTHYFSLRLTAPYGGLTARFMMASGTNFKQVSIAGKQMYNLSKPLKNQRTALKQFYYYGDLSKPVAFSIGIPAHQKDAALQVQITSKTWPAGLMENYNPRPADLMPIPFGISDAVIYRKTFKLQPK